MGDVPGLVMHRLHVEGRDRDPAFGDAVESPEVPLDR